MEYQAMLDPLWRLEEMREFGVVGFMFFEDRTATFYYSPEYLRIGFSVRDHSGKELECSQLEVIDALDAHRKMLGLSHVLVVEEMNSQ